MSEYSYLNLIKHDTTIYPKNRFGKYLFDMSAKTNVQLTLEVPKDHFIRAEIFCDDITSLSEIVYTQNDIVEMLYDDVLQDYRMNPDHELFYLRLLSAEKRIPIKTDAAITVIEKIETEKVQLKVKLMRKEVLRGELALAELEKMYPKHGYTMEKFLTLLYCDFIEAVKSGNKANVVRTIVKRLQEEQ